MAAVGRELKLSSLKNSRDRSMSSLRRGLMQVAVIHMCLFPWSELPELILKGVKKLKNLVASDIQSPIETLRLARGPLRHSQCPSDMRRYPWSLWVCNPGVVDHS